MANLYELSVGYASILDAYDAAETDEEREELLGMLADAGDEISNKAENYVRIIKNVQSDVEGYKAEAKRLTKKATTGENLIERLKNTMLEAMKMTGQTEVETSIGRWKTQLNPMSCDVTDPDKVPERFHVPQPDKIDKAAMIREHKATGEVFDGAEFVQTVGIRFR